MTTTLTVNDTGAVLRSSQSPNTLEELLPFKEILDGLIRSTPATEVTVLDYGGVWYAGQVGNIMGKFAEKSREFSSTDNVIFGTSGSDRIYDTSDSDTLVGGAGNDLIVISSGNDVVYGGPGTDSAFFIEKTLETLDFTRASGQNETDVFDNQTGEHVTLIGVENALFYGEGYPIEFLLM